jgi:hypothetical protein
LVLPDEYPRADVLTDNHFRLPCFYREVVGSQMPDFKQISRLEYDSLPGREKSVPFYAPEEVCRCGAGSGGSGERRCGEGCLNRVSRIECCESLKTTEESICPIGKLIVA